MMFVAKSVGLYLVPSIADLPDQFGVRSTCWPRQKKVARKES